MSSLNKALIIGNLGDDPKVNYTKEGSPVANISIATSENWKDKNGDKQVTTEWHKVVFFGRLAEIAEQYLKKGSKVFVEGKIQTREWEDETGNKRKTTEVVAREMTMLDSKGSSMDNSSAPSSSSSESNNNKPEDDIPF
tara:strand:- start:191 stop:607 length:417 start_codon:yes stop_codon:yes gene_type:complete